MFVEKYTSENYEISIECYKNPLELFKFMTNDKRFYSVIGDRFLISCPFCDELISYEHVVSIFYNKELKSVGAFGSYNIKVKNLF